MHTITFSKMILFLLCTYTLLVRFITGKMRHGGSLVALAIGDALGAPLEGSPQPDVWVTEIRSGGRHFRKKGEVTDDTLQATAVAESLVACKGFDEKDLVGKIIRSTISNDRNGSVLHQLSSLIWCDPGPCRTMLHGSCTRNAWRQPDERQRDAGIPARDLLSGT